MRIIPEINLTLNEIEYAVHSSHACSENVIIPAIVTSSKEVLPGDLFIALPGDKRSGEDYIDEAKARGAYIMSSKRGASDILVFDTYMALLDIASYYKSKLTNLKKTVAITGSVGKTTTKNIVAKMLSTVFKVHATKENYNNFLGFFHTVLTTPIDAEILTVELGMNHLGEISLLSKALKPDISIITKIGSSHIGNLGSREMIAKAKLEIIDGMAHPTVIVPHEEVLLEKIENRYTVSLENPSADCFFAKKDMKATHSTVDIHTSDGVLYSQKIAIPGRHILNSVGFATQLMTLLQIGTDKIESALKALDNSCIRGRFFNIGDITVYDDTYSSSAEAVFADLELLSLYKEHKKSCVLGDMLELGTHTEELHRSIGRAAAERGFEKIFTFGVYSSFIAEGAVAAGMKKDKIFINTDITAPEYTAKQILDNHTEKEIILFKASHGIHAERIPDILASLIKNKNLKDR